VCRSGKFDRETVIVNVSLIFRAREVGLMNIPGSESAETVWRALMAKRIIRHRTIAEILLSLFEKVLSLSLSMVVSSLNCLLAE
jgi:hypothetical protein